MGEGTRASRRKSREGDAVAVAGGAFVCAPPATRRLSASDAAAQFSEPPLAWTENVFNDNDWSEGPSGFGYGDDDDATVLDDMQDNYLTVAVRKRFVLTEEDFGESDDFLLGMTFDDGFCAFVNGVEVARQNCSEDVAWDDVALNSHEAEEEELFLMDPSVLTVGENVLALMGANRRRSDGDFSLIPRLIRKRLIEEDPPEPVVPDFPGSFNELYRGDGNGMGWLELFNEDASMPLDLSGLQLMEHDGRDQIVGVTHERVSQRHLAQLGRAHILR